MIVLGESEEGDPCLQANKLNAKQTHHERIQERGWPIY